MEQQNLLHATHDTVKAVIPAAAGHSSFGARDWRLRPQHSRGSALKLDLEISAYARCAPVSCDTAARSNAPSQQPANQPVSGGSRSTRLPAIQLTDARPLTHVFSSPLTVLAAEPSDCFVVMRCRRSTQRKMLMVPKDSI